MGVLHDPAPRSAEPGGPDALSPSSWRRPWRTKRQAAPPRRPWRVWAALPLPPLRLVKRQLLVLGLLTLVLFADLIAAWPIVQPSTAFALAFKNPNPALSAPSWLNPPTAVKQPNLSKSSTAVTVPVSSTSGPHTWTVSMKPLILHLEATAQKATSSDGQLEVDIPASSLDATQLGQAGGIQLAITQVKPASGRTDNGGFISFGTYEFQFFDGAGNALSGVRLRHPFTVILHLPQDQQMVWSGQQVSTQWTEVKGAANLPAVTAQAAVTAAGVAAVEPQVASASKPAFAYAQRGANGRDWSVQSRLSSSVQQASSDLHSHVVMATTQAVQASTVAFNTQAPQATWGTPTLPQVGLNAGGLNYSYPLSIPAGPGGFQPSLQLNYSSGSVNENHGWQSASPWVGQGWSLDLGSISWAQENVVPNTTGNLENVWHISDPSGIGGQLIPPDLTYRTNGSLNPSASSLPTVNTLSSGTPVLWHTAPESHAKVREIAYNSLPCWRVYLPSGVMEEFGCTSDSRETYQDGSGATDIYNWKLDLMIDAHGNQVHVTYSQISISGTIRDAVLQEITYDDPTCHDLVKSCSSWNPQVDIHFYAGTSVASLLNGGCGSGSSNARCDDPVDISGGMSAPKVMNAYVLNNVKVVVNGHVLHEYVFSYSQSAPGTLADPNTGQSESIAGYLLLGKIQEEGTDGTSLNAPVVTMSYTEKFEHYSDLFYYSDNGYGDICNGSYSAAPRDGTSTAPCYLWSQTHNSYYLSNLDNGRGWHESVTWAEAHANTWGTNNGTNYGDALQCSGLSGKDSQSSTNVCGWADDKNWSRIVVLSRTASSNGVDSTWTYQYLLSDVAASIPGAASSSRQCHGHCESYDWGSQNDNDYADYYNGEFESFKQVQVSLPDGSSQKMTYGATNGWGLFNTATISCAVSGCVNAPYNGSGGPVLAGKPLVEQDYAADGTLMKQINTSWTMNCPPQGTNGSANAGSSGNPGGTYLFSTLDQSNPVLVCDPRISQTDTYLVDGIATSINTSSLDPRVVHTTTTTNYDGNTCGATGHDYGNVSQTDTTANDVGGAHIVTSTLFCPHDSLSSSMYLTDLPAQMQTLDGAGTAYGCTQNYYGSNTSVTATPSVPDVTRSDGYLAYTGGCTGSAVTTLHGYDASGNGITNTDADGHQGCTMPGDSTQYSACATYDGFGTHLTTATNAKNQVTSYEYYPYDTASPETGYGQWLMAETDINGQTTTYQYDALGRLTAVIRPGDSVSSPSVVYTYINKCSAGTTTPCLEIDTATRFTVGGPLSTQKAWYDGWGNQVETQTPGPNLYSKVPAIPSVIVNYTVYDKMGHATIKSQPYAVAATAGLGYVAPDLNQARTVTSSDSLGRSLGVATYSNASTIVEKSQISYLVAQGVPTIASESSTPYEQTVTLDAYYHQSITYTDGLGRSRYSQVFTGTTSPYSVVRTVGTTYDTAGNLIETRTYDSTGTLQATASATYDGLGQVTGSNDSDQGSCQNTPMPTDCSGTTDTAWKYTYDPDGNPLSQTDPRGISTYTTYDVLDRPLCRALSATDASSCSGTTNAVFFYDGYSNASTPNATFPTGCAAPTGNYASDPIGGETAEWFMGASGAGSGWRCYGYDQRGRTDQSMLSVTTPDAGTVTQTVNMTYDDQNDVTSLIYPDGETLTFNYNGNGVFQSAYFGTTTSTDPVNFLVGKATYTNNGQLASLAMGGSAPKSGTPTALFTLNQGYDSIGRQTSTSVVRGTTTLFSQTRAFDNAGNVLGVSTSTQSQSGSTVTDNESFCYDALGRLVWAGNSGTPTGGDHCMAPPTGSSVPGYTQGYSYDSLDRITSGSAGTYTYGDANQIHGVTSMSSVPNPYAAYDAMGNMICRNDDTTSAHSCAANAFSGATMTYDSEGRLSSWTAPGGTNANETYLYDPSGNLVLTTTSNNGTPTDTIKFDGYTEIVLSGGTTTTTKYYGAAGQTLAENVNGTLSYLVPDLLGSVVAALNSSGTLIAVQLYGPYGKSRYSWGSMPTAYNYTGQRLDSQSGFVYYQSRWYDPFADRFLSTDTLLNNAAGMDPYAYVNNNPETMSDPTGHFGWQDLVGYTVTALVVAVVVIAIIAAPEVVIAVAAAAATEEGVALEEDAMDDAANDTGACVEEGCGNDDPCAEEACTNNTCEEDAACNTSANCEEGGCSTSGDDCVESQCSYHTSGAGDEPNTSDDPAGNNENNAGDDPPSNNEGGGGQPRSPLGNGAGDGGAGDDVGGGGDPCDDLSFRTDTPVATAQGEQAIGTLKVGQNVWSYNPTTKQMELEPIQKIWLNHDNDLVDLTLVATITGADGKTTQQSEVVHTNEKHPFLTKEKGFVPVSQLKPGMHVLEANGSYGVVATLVVVPGGMWMYNLTVAQDHTYAVGLGQWIVHNCDGDGNRVDWNNPDNQQRIQHLFNRHAAQWGLGGMNWNTTTTVQAIKNALINHLEDPYTNGIPGTYKGVTAVTHFYNALTDLDLMVDTNGIIRAGFRLGPMQLWYLLGVNGNVQ